MLGWSLARFCLTWRHGYSAWRPEDIAALDRWRARDKKRWEAEDQQRQRLSGQRRMIFHAAARRIVAGAGMIVFDQLDLARLARNPRDGSSHVLPDMARHYRVLACLHKLRHWVGVQAERAGVPVTVHKGSTRVCWECGTPREKDGDRDRLVVTCRGCGRSYDQDVNDCRFMLRERAGGAKNSMPDQEAA